MTTKKFTWVGAAMAALTLALAGPAHALKVTLGGAAISDLTATSAKDDLTFSKETLLKGAANQQEASDDADATTYYKVGAAAHQFAFGLKRQITAIEGGQRVYIIVTLDGMVFTGENANPVTVTIGGTTLSGGPFVNGGRGDNTGYWLVTGGPYAKGAIVNVGSPMAVSENGGGIKIEVRDARYDDLGLATSEVHERAGIVKVASSLDETMIVGAEDPTARVALGFMAFGGTERNPVKTAKLGTIKIGVKTTHLRQGADGLETEDYLSTVHGTGGITVADDGTDPLENPVTFGGEVGFVGKGKFGLAATGSGATACASIADLRVMKNGAPTGDLATTKKAADFTANAMDLCVMADGETAIPATVPYTVTTSYKGLTNAAFPPPGTTHQLAAIQRDGTAIHIPFVTLNEKFNQRVLLRNRSGSDVTYSITFSPEPGTTATAGTDATGTVGAGDMKVLLAKDVVSLAGKERTAATLTAPAAKGTLDVATSIVNRETGAIDVETHMPQ